MTEEPVIDLPAAAAPKPSYPPYQIWCAVAATGLASLLGMLIFTRRSKRRKDQDV